MRIILTLMAIMAVAAIASGAASTNSGFVEFDPAKTALTLNNPTCLHDTPSDENEAIMCFTKDTELTIVGKIEKKVKIDGKEGYWYKVDLGDGEDYYVFSGYLKMEMYGYVEK